MPQRRSPDVKALQTVVRLTIILALIAIFIVLTAPAVSAQELFVSAGKYDSGGQIPWSAAMADVNGDGKLDAVIINSGTNTVAVLLGNGTGGFGVPTTYTPGGSFPRSVGLADLNGDGKTDIVVANIYGGAGVLLGNGDGTFQPVVLYGSSILYDAVSLAIADLNFDGRFDLAVTFDGHVAILLGNGDGTFQAPVTYPWGSGSGTSWGSNSLAVQDVNADGKADLVAATGDSNYPFGPATVAVLLGNGDGTFGAATDYNSGGEYAYSLAVQDVNADGKPDLVVSHTCISVFCGTLGVLLGNGDGTFRTAVLYNPGGLVPWSVRIADVNADNQPDVVVCNECADSACVAGRVGVLLGNGDGTFQLPLTFATQGQRYPTSVTIADVIGDSRPDLLVTTGQNYGWITVLRNNSAAPHVPTTTTLASSLNPSIYGQSVTLTATVTTTGSDPLTGTVAFTWGDAFKRYTIGQATLNASGVATLTKSNLNADPYAMTAVYKGDTIHLGSTSPVVNQTVLQTSSTATLTASPNPSKTGQAVTFTAKISSPTVTPTGPVTFKAGTVVLGTVQLSGGKSVFTTSALAAGKTTVTATYDGNSNIAKSSASVTQQVNP